MKDICHGICCSQWTPARTSSRSEWTHSNGQRRVGDGWPIWRKNRSYAGTHTWAAYTSDFLIASPIHMVKKICTVRSRQQSNNHRSSTMKTIRVKCADKHCKRRAFKEQEITTRSQSSFDCIEENEVNFNDTERRRKRMWKSTEFLGRWVTYLFSKATPAKVVRAVTFVSFAKERIEGLAHAHRSSGVAGDRKGGNPSHPSHWVHARQLSRFIKAFGISQVLRHALQKGQRFVEVHLPKAFKNWGTRNPKNTLPFLKSIRLRGSNKAPSVIA